MQWFENNEQYTDPEPIPAEFAEYGTLSLVRVGPSGKTESGWGAKDFVTNREAGRFAVKRSVDAFTKFRQPFAFVMRSIPFVCIDIDGKNGGLQTAQLLRLPETLAERSKGGNGYHLFYRIPMATWNALRGFDDLEDHNGIIPGVDIRGTGVVYHHDNQKWNGKPIAELPMTFYDLLTRAKQIRHNAKVTRHGTEGLDEDELVIIHDRLATQLAQPAKVGTRNQRLYAIGTQMYATAYPDWEIRVTERGEELGLSISEIHSIIENIFKYG
jgi:hypothetical protein